MSRFFDTILNIEMHQLILYLELTLTEIFYISKTVRGFRKQIKSEIGFKILVKF